MARACAEALDDINLSGTRRQKEAEIAGRKLFLDALEAAVKELEIDPRGKTDVEFKEEALKYKADC